MRQKEVRRVNFQRITSEQDKMYREAMNLYQISFPEHEQREEPSQKRILHNENYHFTLIFDEKIFVGLILYWENVRFLYVEHFCIRPQLRGRSYGRKTLDLLNRAAEKNDKKVILEIDPPIDEVSIRRKGFYEKAHYQANGFSHIHPPYHRNHQGHSLVVMSYPAALSQADYQEFDRYLREIVMDQAIPVEQIEGGC